MIFNSEFDRALWLMVKGDIKNRRKIIDFIKSIPSELILSIRNSLLEYDKYKIENEGISHEDREYRCFNKQIYNSIGELYSFNIDIRSDILSITKSIYIMGAYYKSFSLELVNMDRSIELSKVIEIGNISYSVEGVRNLRNINYGIMDIGLINVLVSSVNNGVYSFCGFVNVDKDINLKLDNNSGKLIRTKKNIGDEKINV